MYLSMRVELRCEKCDAELQAEEQPNGIVSVRPHICEVQRDVSIYIEDLIELLNMKEVEIHYRKKNGEFRIMHGKLIKVENYHVFFTEVDEGFKMLLYNNIDAVIDGNVVFKIIK